MKIMIVILQWSQTLYSIDEEPLLPIGIEILDIKVLSENLSTGESLYVTYSNGKYYLKSRIFNYDTDWYTHFQIDRATAQQIVGKGYAAWWINVDESVR